MKIVTTLSCQKSTFHWTLPFILDTATAWISHALYINGTSHKPAACGQLSYLPHKMQVPETQFKVHSTFSRPPSDKCYNVMNRTHTFSPAALVHRPVCLQTQCQSPFSPCTYTQRGIKLEYRSVPHMRPHFATLELTLTENVRGLIREGGRIYKNTVGVRIQVSILFPLNHHRMVHNSHSVST